MNLIFLYGPLAAGKLTVGIQLAAMTGYRLLDNHRVIDYICEILLERTVQSSRQKNKIATKQRWLEAANEHPWIFEHFSDVQHPTINNSDLTPRQAAQAILDRCRINQANMA